MKKYLLHISLFTLLVLVSCDQKPADANKEEPKVEDDVVEEKATPKPLDAMPYTVSVNVSATQPDDAIGIQSSAHAYNGEWVLMIGGRIQGFHGTANAGGVFESKYSNDKACILNPKTGEFKSLALPEEYKEFLMSTNMEYYYDGTYMICAGGYGAYCTTCSPERFKTFPRLTTVNMADAIDAIKNGDADKLKNSIVSIEDERFRVTGGGLEKIGDDYFMVFGQNYDTIYIGGITGKYTEQIRSFKLGLTADNITVTDYQEFKDPSGKTGAESEYHRRDLNVVGAMRPDGSEGISVLGGVFTTKDGGWVHPILINGVSATDISIYTDLVQKVSQYECAHVNLYDPSSKASFTTLLGGISGYSYVDGTLTPGVPVSSLPFTPYITTVVHNEAGMQEFPQPEDQSLPKLLGSDAIFMANHDLTFANDDKTVIDLSSLPTGKTLVGWMYGGILATAAQSNEMNPTFANSKIYEVWVNM